MKKLFVASLAWSVDDAKLGDFLAQAGNVISAQVIKDRDTGRSRGFGFVEMSTPEEAQNAIKNLNNSEIDGRKIVVKIAEQRSR